jgi:hypothetical protein
MLSLGISADLYEAEALPGVFNQVWNDIGRIMWVTGASGNAVTVYIMETTTEDDYYAVNNALVCTKTTFEDSSYVSALAQAMYGNYEQWFGWGLRGLANGTSSAVERLHSYYNENNNLNLLGLTPLRFESTWCNEEELKLAEDTSIALCEYTLEAYDAQTLATGMTGAIKTEWLHSIGVNETFSDPYTEYLRGFTLSIPESNKFAVTLTSSRDRFNLNYLENFFETADQVEAFVFDNQAGREKITELLSQEAPELLDKMNLGVAVTYNIYGGSSPRKHGWKPSGIISFTNDPIYHLHECVHGMIGTQDRNHWIDEGLAVYLSSVFFPSELTAQAFQSRFIYCIENSNIVLDTNDLWNIDFTACNYYLANGGNVDLLDMRLAVDSYAFSTMLHPEIEYSECFSSPVYAENRIPSTNRLEADELSYHQAGSFVAYLVDNYSLTAVLSYALNEQDFRLPLESLIRN